MSNVDSDSSVPTEIPKVTNQNTRIDIDPSTRSTPKRKYGACRIGLFIVISLVVLILLITLSLGVSGYFGYIGSRETKTETKSDSDILIDNSTAPRWNKESLIEKEMVSNILNSLNRSVDPCENFYEFSCGNWAKFNPRPSGYSDSLYWSPDELLEYKSAEVLHGTLMETPYLDEDLKTRSAKILYQNCVGDSPTSLISLTHSSSNTTKAVRSSVNLKMLTKGIPKEVMSEVNFAELEKKLIGEEISQMSVRDTCLETVKTVIGKRWIERLYLKNLFLDKSKVGKISVMMRNIQRSMGELIVNSTIPLTSDKGEEWRVKAESIQTFLNILKPCIGYYKKLLEEDHSSVETTDQDNAKVQEHDLEDVPPFCFWDRSPFNSRPTYYPLGRSIEIPYSATETPYFEHGRPSAMNYGSIGAILGHEVAHAINIESYQEANDLGPGPSCLVDHYGEFNEKINWTLVVGNTSDTIDISIMLDGAGTLEENFADNLGLRAAFAAFHALSPRFQRNLVSGLKEFSNDQLFFISYGQSWCADVPEEFTGYQLMDDYAHSPPSFRVLGTLQNSEEFATAFRHRENCVVHN